MAGPKYGEKNYKQGFNSRGLPSKSVEDFPKVSTPRGEARKARGKKPHSHEWVMRTFYRNTSYHEARVANEARYDCRGCGDSCRTPVT